MLQFNKALSESDVLSYLKGGTTMINAKIIVDYDPLNPMMAYVEKNNPELAQELYADPLKLSDIINEHTEKMKVLCTQYMSFIQYIIDMEFLFKVMREPINVEVLKTGILIVEKEYALYVILECNNNTNFSMVFQTYSTEECMEVFGTCSEGCYILSKNGIIMKNTVNVLINLINAHIEQSTWHMDELCFPLYNNNGTQIKEQCSDLQKGIKRMNKGNRIYDVMINNVPQLSFCISDDAESSAYVVGGDMMVPVIGDAKSIKARWNSGDDERFNIQMEHSTNDLLLLNTLLLNFPDVIYYQLGYEFLHVVNIGKTEKVIEVLDLFINNVCSVLQKKFETLCSTATYTDPYGTEFKADESPMYQYYTKYMRK